MSLDILGTKHESLRELVGELSRRLPPRTFVLVDEWDDPFAIGLGKPSVPGHLVYISSEKDINGRIFISRELPPASDMDAFRDAGANWFQDIDALARAVGEHLSRA